MFTRYVALGDSSTEGLDDPHPDGGYRGWADRLAEKMAAAYGEITYANLAVRGRLTREIADEQLDAAVALGPDVATVVAGMNDLIRPKFDVRAVMGDIERMQRALVGAGATVVTFTLPTPGPGMPLARVLKPRVARYNTGLRAVCRRTGARFLDLEPVPAASDPRLWSEDRLHGNSEGHERIARGLAHTLGVPGDHSGWDAALPPLARTPLPKALAADLAWARVHLVPWVIRHVRGQSSGDGIEPKRPEPLLIVARP